MLPWGTDRRAFRSTMSSRKARAFPSLSRRKPPGSDPGAAGAGHIQLGSHMVPFRARTDSYEGLTLDFDDAAGRVDNLWACMPVRSVILFPSLPSSS